jgi:hypothetical protein
MIIVCQKCGHHNSYGEISTRLWYRVDKSKDCWEWTGTPSQYGYGELTVDGRTYLAHRLAWELTFGPIPENMCVCHKCDNRICCNPNHLFLGSKNDNIVDMIKKGRGRKLAKFTYEESKQILSEYKTGNFTCTYLAKKYGVSRQIISNIVNGISYNDY